MSLNTFKRKITLNTGPITKFNEGPQFALILQNKLEQSEISTITKLLASCGLAVYQSQTIDRKKNILLIELSNPQLIFQEAMDIQIMKSSKINEGNAKDGPFFASLDHKNSISISTLPNILNSIETEEDKFKIGSGSISPSINSIFSPTAESSFNYFKSEKVNKIPQKQQKKLLNQIDPRILMYEKLKPLSLSISDREFLGKGIGIFTPAERLRITYSYLNRIYLNDTKFIQLLQQLGSIEEIVPFHEKNAIINNNLQSFEDYYGQNISVYFEFLDYYQKWLKVPAVTGLFLFLFSYLLPSFQEISNFIFSIIMCVWVTLFYIFWKRRQSELQVKWGVFGKNLTKEDKNVHFQGTKRIKTTTMEILNHFPKQKRVYLYLLSACHGIPLLTLSFALKVVVFNLNGIITEDVPYLYFESIAQLTLSDGILYHLPFKEVVFNLIMIIIVISMNNFYMGISKISTNLENHQTNFYYNYSLALKRFIFELINRFTHFFFLAFFIRYFNKVKTMISSIFLLDEIRKVLTETVIPWMSKSSSQYENFRNDELSNQCIESIKEIDYWKYDNFDDYIDIVSQIAYICLFAAISPHSASLSYIFNIFERRSDQFKLQNRLYRRPLPILVQGIGAWNKILLLISILCVYTNASLLVLDHFNFFTSKDDSIDGVCTDYEQYIREQYFISQISFKNIFLSFFTIEHLLLIVIIALHLSIDPIPKWVRVLRRRMEHNQKLEQQNYTNIY